jgi:hypothetical protein
VKKPERPATAPPPIARDCKSSKRCKDARKCFLETESRFPRAGFFPFRRIDFAVRNIMPQNTKPIRLNRFEKAYSSHLLGNSPLFFFLNFFAACGKNSDLLFFFHRFF